MEASLPQTRQKLFPNWKGPYNVVNVYSMVLISSRLSKESSVHALNLKNYTFEDMFVLIIIGPLGYCTPSYRKNNKNIMMKPYELHTLLLYSFLQLTKEACFPLCAFAKSIYYITCTFITRNDFLRYRAKLHL